MQELEFISGFILHTRPFKENQLIAEMLLAGEGRISVITYKGSKNNSAKSALMQPFRPLQVQVKPGRGLHKLKSVEAELGELGYQLTSKSLFCGFYLNEIICRLCQADAHFPELHPLYVYALEHLRRAQQNYQGNLYAAYIELVLRQFESRLLALLGYELNFTHEFESDSPVVDSMYYELFNDVGFIHTNIAQRGLLGQDLLAIDNLLNTDIDIESVNPQHLKQAKHILRACLHRHLGDKPLKSRELFRK